MCCLPDSCYWNLGRDYAAYADFLKRKGDLVGLKITFISPLKYSVSAVPTDGPRNMKNNLAPFHDKIPKAPQSTDTYVRWCERGMPAGPSPIPIISLY